MDTTSATQGFIGYLHTNHNGIIYSAIAFALGLIVKHFYDTYKSRKSVFRYRLFESLLGFSSDTAIVGRTRFFYNDNLVNNFFSHQFFLKNFSSNDFEKIVLRVWSDVGSQILWASCHKKSSMTQIEIAPEFLKKFEEASEGMKNLLMGSREFLVPVYNRGEEIEITCYTTNAKEQKPGVYLECDFKGVKVERMFFEQPILWGVPQHRATLVGLIFGILALILLNRFELVGKWYPYVTFLVGAFVTVPGVAIIKFYRMLHHIRRSFIGI